MSVACNSSQYFREEFYHLNLFWKVESSSRDTDTKME